MRTTNALLVAVFLWGCLKPPPPPIPITGFQSPACDVIVHPRVEDICDGLYTIEGLACASCVGGSACIAVQEVVYCVSTGSCLLDERCKPEPLPRPRAKTH